MTHKERIIQLARSYVGTPYHHQARVPGVGIDCVGILVCIVREIGIVPAEWDYNNYLSEAQDDALLDILNQYLVTTASPESGDVLTFRMGRWPHHVAVLSGENTIIHSYASIGRVVETNLDEVMRNRIIATHAIPEVI